MSLPLETTIDPTLCDGCALCASVCPAEIISVQGDTARVTGPADRCLHCAHCAAVCPPGAVTVPSATQAALGLATVSQSPSTAPLPSTASLVRLMAGRRSCRAYRDKPVSRALLEDLVRIGITAPSGTNSQRWTFTLLPGRRAMERFGALTARFFSQLNFVVRFAPVRLAARLVSGDTLELYYREYYERVQEALDEWRRTGRDLLFHGAPAAIFIGSRPGGTTPKEDALLAAQNILLAAETMGLGTCLVGYAVEALAADPRIKREMGIPKEERVHAVIAVGYPKVPWKRPAGRRLVTPRLWEG